MNFCQHIEGHIRRYGSLAVCIATSVMVISGLTLSGTAQASINFPSHVLSQKVKQPGLKTAPSAIQAGSSYFICLTNAQEYCLASLGTGEQVKITYNGLDWSTFHIVGTGTFNGWAKYQFENGNGNCLRAGTNNIVKIENGSCVSSDSADWWVSNDGAGSNRWVSEYYGGPMLTHGDVNWYKVWHANPVSGDWTQWTLYQG